MHPSLSAEYILPGHKCQYITEIETGQTVHSHSYLNTNAAD